MHGGRRGRDPRLWHRHHRLAHRERHLRPPSRARGRDRALPRPPLGDDLPDRLPGQSRHAGGPRRAARRDPAGRRFALQHLRRLPAERRHGDPLPPQRPRGSRPPARPAAGPGRVQADRGRGHLQHARRPGAARRVRRGQAPPRRLSAGRRGAFAGRARRAAAAAPPRSRASRPTSTAWSAPSARAWARSAASARPTIRSSTRCASAAGPTCSPPRPRPRASPRCSRRSARSGARPELRRRIWDNAQALYDGLSAAGFEICAKVSPIIAVRLPDERSAVLAWNRLLEHGVYVNLALPPGTPNGMCLLRCSVSAAHTPAQIDEVCRRFARWLRPSWPASRPVPRCAPRAAEQVSESRRRGTAARPARSTPGSDGAAARA